MNPPAKNFIDTSAPTEATREQPAVQSPTRSDPPSLHNTVSLSPDPTPQILSQKVDDRGDLISPESHGGSAVVDKSQNERPDASSMEMLQHPPPDAGDNRSESGPVSSENRDGSARIDEGQSEGPDASFGVVLQDTPSDADRECSGSNTLQNNLGGHGMLLVSIPPTCTLHAGGGSALNTRDEYRQDGQSRDPSRTFTRLVMSSTLVTPRTDTNLPNNSFQNHLGQDNQSGSPVSPISSGLPNWDLEPTRDDLHSGGEGTSRLDLLNTEDGALPRKESMEGASATDVSRTDNNASRGYHTSPKLQLSLILWVSESDSPTANDSRNKSHTGVSENLPKGEKIPFPQIHQDQRGPLQEPGPHDGASNPRTDDIPGLCVLSPWRSHIY